MQNTMTQFKVIGGLVTEVLAVFCFGPQEPAANDEKFNS